MANLSLWGNLVSKFTVKKTVSKSTSCTTSTANMAKDRDKDKDTATEKAKLPTEKTADLKFDHSCQTKPSRDYSVQKILEKPPKNDDQEHYHENKPNKILNTRASIKNTSTGTKTDPEMINNSCQTSDFRDMSREKLVATSPRIKTIYSKDNKYPKERLQSETKPIKKSRHYDVDASFRYPTVNAVYRTVSGLKLQLSKKCKHYSHDEDDKGKSVCEHCGAMFVVSDSLKHPVYEVDQISSDHSIHHGRRRHRRLKHVNEDPAFLELSAECKIMEGRISNLERSLVEQNTLNHSDKPLLKFDMYTQSSLNNMGNKFPPIMYRPTLSITNHTKASSNQTGAPPNLGTTTIKFAQNIKNSLLRSRSPSPAQRDTTKMVPLVVPPSPPEEKYVHKSNLPRRKLSPSEQRPRLRCEAYLNKKPQTNFADTDSILSQILEGKPYSLNTYSNSNTESISCDAPTKITNSVDKESPGKPKNDSPVMRPSRYSHFTNDLISICENDSKSVNSDSKTVRFSTKLKDADTVFICDDTPSDTIDDDVGHRYIQIPNTHKIFQSIFHKVSELSDIINRTYKSDNKNPKKSHTSRRTDFNNKTSVNSSIISKDALGPPSDSFIRQRGIEHISTDGNVCKPAMNFKESAKHVDFSFNGSSNRNQIEQNLVTNLNDEKICVNSPTFDNIEEKTSLPEKDINKNLKQISATKQSSLAEKQDIQYRLSICCNVSKVTIAAEENYIKKPFNKIEEVYHVHNTLKSSIQNDEKQAFNNTFKIDDTPKSLEISAVSNKNDASSTELEVVGKNSSAGESQISTEVKILELLARNNPDLEYVLELLKRHKNSEKHISDRLIPSLKSSKNNNIFENTVDENKLDSNIVSRLPTAEQKPKHLLNENKSENKLIFLEENSPEVKILSRHLTSTQNDSEQRNLSRNSSTEKNITTKQSKCNENYMKTNPVEEKSNEKISALRNSTSDTQLSPSRSINNKLCYKNNSTENNTISRRYSSQNSTCDKNFTIEQSTNDDDSTISNGVKNKTMERKNSIPEKRLSPKKSTINENYIKTPPDDKTISGVESKTIGQKYSSRNSRWDQKTFSSKRLSKKESYTKNEEGMANQRSLSRNSTPERRLLPKRSAINENDIKINVANDKIMERRNSSRNSSPERRLSPKRSTMDGNFIKINSIADKIIDQRNSTSERRLSPQRYANNENSLKNEERPAEERSLSRNSTPERSLSPKRSTINENYKKINAAEDKSMEQRSSSRNSTRNSTFAAVDRRPSPKQSINIGVNHKTMEQRSLSRNSTPERSLSLRRFSNNESCLKTDNTHEGMADRRSISRNSTPERSVSPKRYSTVGSGLKNNNTEERTTERSIISRRSTPERSVSPKRYSTVGSGLKNDNTEERATDRSSISRRSTPERSVSPKRYSTVGSGLKNDNTEERATDRSSISRRSTPERSVSPKRYSTVGSGLKNDNTEERATDRSSISRRSTPERSVSPKRYSTVGSGLKNDNTEERATDRSSISRRSTPERSVSPKRFSTYESCLKNDNTFQTTTDRSRNSTLERSMSPKRYSTHESCLKNDNTVERTTDRKSLSRKSTPERKLSPKRSTNKENYVKNTDERIRDRASISSKSTIERKMSPKRSTNNENIIKNNATKESNAVSRNLTPGKGISPKSNTNTAKLTGTKPKTSVKGNVSQNSSPERKYSPQNSIKSGHSINTNKLVSRASSPIRGENVEISTKKLQDNTNFTSTALENTNFISKTTEDRPLSPAKEFGESKKFTKGKSGIPLRIDQQNSRSPRTSPPLSPSLSPNLQNNRKFSSSNKLTSKSCESWISIDSSPDRKSPVNSKIPIRSDRSLSPPQTRNTSPSSTLSKIPVKSSPDRCSRKSSSERISHAVPIKEDQLVCPEKSPESPKKTSPMRDKFKPKGSNAFTINPDFVFSKKTNPTVTTVNPITGEYETIDLPMNSAHCFKKNFARQKTPLDITNPRVPNFAKTSVSVVDSFQTVKRQGGTKNQNFIFATSESDNDPSRMCNDSPRSEPINASPRMNQEIEDNYAESLIINDIFEFDSDEMGLPEENLKDAKYAIPVPSDVELSSALSDELEDNSNESDNSGDKNEITNIVTSILSGTNQMENTDSLISKQSNKLVPQYKDDSLPDSVEISDEPKISTMDENQNANAQCQQIIHVDELKNSKKNSKNRRRTFDLKPVPQKSCAIPSKFSSQNKTKNTTVNPVSVKNQSTSSIKNTISNKEKERFLSEKIQQLKERGEKIKKD